MSVLELLPVPAPAPAAIFKCHSLLFFTPNTGAGRRHMSSFSGMAEGSFSLCLPRSQCDTECVVRRCVCALSEGRQLRVVLHMVGVGRGRGQGAGARSVWTPLHPCCGLLVLRSGLMSVPETRSHPACPAPSPQGWHSEGAGRRGQGGGDQPDAQSSVPPLLLSLSIHITQELCVRGSERTAEAECPPPAWTSERQSAPLQRGPQRSRVPPSGVDLREAECPPPAWTSERQSVPLQHGPQRGRVSLSSMDLREADMDLREAECPPLAWTSERQSAPLQHGPQRDRVPHSSMDHREAEGPVGRQSSHIRLTLAEHPSGNFPLDPSCPSPPVSAGMLGGVSRLSAGVFSEGGKAQGFGGGPCGDEGRGDSLLACRQVEEGQGKDGSFRTPH
ncbi:hypothetical protein JZ751_020891, partial [Albula glossodonta]